MTPLNAHALALKRGFRSDWDDLSRQLAIVAKAGTFYLPIADGLVNGSVVTAILTEEEPPAKALTPARRTFI